MTSLPLPPLIESLPASVAAAPPVVGAELVSGQDRAADGRADNQSGVVGRVRLVVGNRQRQGADRGIAIAVPDSDRHVAGIGARADIVGVSGRLRERIVATG